MPYNYLSAAQLKEIDRLRCFVVINFQSAVFHPLFRNVNNFFEVHNGLVGKWDNAFPHSNAGLILMKMRENVALCYGLSHFRQVNSLPKTPAIFGWRPISEVRKLARFFFRHELQDGSILVQYPY